jgi:hypothetical protein
MGIITRVGMSAPVSGCILAVFGSAYILNFHAVVQWKLLFCAGKGWAVTSAWILNMAVQIGGSFLPGALTSSVCELSHHLKNLTNDDIVLLIFQTTLHVSIVLKIGNADHNLAISPRRYNQMLCYAFTYWVGCATDKRHIDMIRG